MLTHKRPTPPPPPHRRALTAIWAQLPINRRRRLQRLLAELLARAVGEGSVRGWGRSCLVFVLCNRRGELV